MANSMNSNKKPLLSICIPTYNRAEQLEDSLESIVHQTDFDDRVEVVISDNCSSDNTETIGRAYSKKYSNIRYFRNDTNIFEINQQLVLNRADGYLRKLSNDTIVYKEDSIRYMLNAANECLKSEDVVFFYNFDGRSVDRAYDMNGFLDLVTYWITWIGSFTVWEDDLPELNKIYDVTIETKLPQVYYILELLKKRNVRVYEKNIMIGKQPKVKNIPYGMVKVFYYNFLSLLKKFVQEGFVTENVYNKVKDEILYEFFPTQLRIIKLKGNYDLNGENLESEVENLMIRDNRMDRLPRPRYNISEVGQLKGKRIIIYGAGNVGQSFVRINRDEKIFDLTGWVDKNSDVYEYLHENIRPVEWLSVNGR